MSVLNQSGEEQVECPLCMEPLEVDDLNFFPCTCGYQICRFCWHRIRTDENGLCPACRKAYSEDPADFIPLSQEEVAKLKSEKRQRDQQRKAKLSESRKHLASVRVVQRNLVFVVGLPMRLADPEVLKRHEYFGKFGKIHKVVINQSTSYAGAQGPSASAYVTYMKSDDALRAIQSVNNIVMDGRLIKSSLGTTKYCSHFMKNQPCPKPDCMYLHDFGDSEASFTKEQMHVGKHQEYEKKLHEALVEKSKTTSNAITTSISSSSSSSSTSSSSESVNTNTSTTNKENWPQLNNNEGSSSVVSKDNNSCGSSKKEKDKTTATSVKTSSSATSNNKHTKTSNNAKEKKKGEVSAGTGPVVETTVKIIEEAPTSTNSIEEITSAKSRLSNMLDDNSSFFSHNSFHKKNNVILLEPNVDDDDNNGGGDEANFSDILNNIESTSEDWAAAFGFPKIEQQLFTPPPAPPRNNGHSDFSSSNGNSDYLRANDNFFDVLTHHNQTLQQLLQSQQLSNAKNLHQQQQQQQQQQSYYGNGVAKEDYPHLHPQQQKLLSGINGGYSNGYVNQDRVQQQLMHQRKLEEQVMNLSLINKQQQQYGQPINGGGGYQLFQQHQDLVVNGAPVAGSSKLNRSLSEDELDFDPFQETQKALAELMANEQINYNNSSKHSRQQQQHQVNGHSQAGKQGILPPPPPGFVQPAATHMNSFGSKILPFLNMSSNSQAQPISPTTQNGWPNYNMPQQQQHKSNNIGIGGNDWKDFDSAIVTTSRHYPFNVPPTMRGDHFNTQRSAHDYNNGFSNFTQQIQPPNNYHHNYSTLNSSNMNTPQQQQQLPQQQQQQQQHNWFNQASEINSSQISSPPGFRNQATKQQEC